VDVDQQFVVEAIEAVVERRVVQADGGDAGQRSVGGRDRADPAGDDATADRLLVIPGGELAALWVAEQQPDPYATLRLGAQGRKPLRVLLGEEQAREGEHVDGAAGAEHRAA
jgi:hypothetical protein